MAIIGTAAGQILRAKGINFKFNKSVLAVADKTDVELEKIGETAIRSKFPDNEIFIHILSKSPLVWVTRLAPKGHVPVAEWWAD